MYSGTTLTKFSGRIIGTHQKFDRVARGHLEKLLPDDSIFPKTGKILHFEGRNGPDAIKRKSPAKDEPFHFYSPFDDDDSDLIELIDNHYKRLIKELKSGNAERSAFEAAWLAHAVVDGLTPAHHYPYEDKIDELWDTKSERDSGIKKFVPPGDTKRQRAAKTWKYIGPKGLFNTHALYEMGVATIAAPLGMSEALPTSERLEEARELGPIEIFKRSAREIAVLDMYTRYQKRGWSTKLIYDTRHKLCPVIVQTVTLVWYLALVDAGLVKIKS
jgi:hypothetical protein